MEVSSNIIMAGVWTEAISLISSRVTDVPESL